MMMTDTRPKEYIFKRKTFESTLEFQGTFDGGSVGGTPHSGNPLGRSMRFGSQSSSAAALNRC